MCYRCDSGVDRRALLKTGLLAGAAAGVMGAGTLVPTAAPAQAVGAAPPTDAVKIVESWPKQAAESAKKLIAKYGQPNEATPSILVWFNNGPWKRTIITKEEVDHDFPMPHKDVMQQFIDYRVPPEKFDDLAKYDGSVIAERTKGELSARCDKEEANFLALNLANDIVHGKRTVEDARKFYADTIQAFMKGEKPPYTQGFQFELPKGNQGDRDKAVMKG